MSKGVPYEIKQVSNCLVNGYQSRDNSCLPRPRPCSALENLRLLLFRLLVQINALQPSLCRTKPHHVVHLVRLCSFPGTYIMQSLLLLGREKRTESAFAGPPEEELLDGFRKENVETILSQVNDSVRSVSQEKYLRRVSRYQIGSRTLHIQSGDLSARVVVGLRPEWE